MPLAQLDIKEAERWYEKEAVRGDDFLAAAEATIGRIQESPFQFPIVWRDVRRALLRRFPYGLFFRVETDTVVVIACFHGRRDPRRLVKRRMS